MDRWIEGLKDGRDEAIIDQHNNLDHICRIGQGNYNSKNGKNFPNV